ncbi:MAG: MFS transporter, partial [Thermoleophilia bacterium]|nr:MFS transporter [Thermoleophilia bacterium]
MPIVLLVLVAGILAFTSDQPLVLAALAAGAVVFLLAAPGHPGHLVLIGALVSAAGVLILTPLVSGQGDLVLFTIPMPPL